MINAEKFKAALVPPKGKNQVEQMVKNVGEMPDKGISMKDLKNLIMVLKNKCDDEGDDDFLHITCHVDQNMRQKIGRGEFVELEKLLPRSRSQIMNSEDSIEIMKNGSTYILPAGGSKEPKINNVQRWEQAFRVYVAIYSEINPSRSSEIWQYVHIINTAAASFMWENVAFYDYTFRQLMESKPQRSWAKIYNQMWNISMKDHLQRGGNNVSNFGTPGPGGTSKRFRDWHDKCCWRYNKGKCKRWDCKWDHCCTVIMCGSYSHPAIHCSKRKGATASNNLNHSKERPGGEAVSK